MSKYLEGEVQKALLNINVERAYVNGGDHALLIKGEPVKATVVGRIDETPYQLLDEVYGYEVWVVFQIGDQYFKQYGYWSSHEGRGWDRHPCKEVQAKTKVVEYYE